MLDWNDIWKLKLGVSSALRDMAATEGKTATALLVAAQAAATRARIPELH
jgi:hypothetical protein